MSSTALRSSYLRSVVRPLVFICLAFLFALPLLADSHVRIVRLSLVDGDVQLDKADGRGFGTAYVNMPIVHQSKLWARDGQAEVELEDGSSIRLTPDTIVAFNDLSLDNNGGRTTSVELQQGTAYFDIRFRDSDHFQLDFARNHISLDKAARFRVNVDKHDFEVAVLSGEIEVENASNAEV
ncbi:MAG TPA: FecR family protein, partial [Terriglobales bacterium]|nr:FecR family protein [Terriglobales bacterium]